MELGVGFIGFGFMGRMQAFCHRALPWYYDLPVTTRLVAVATSRPETAEKAKRHGFEFATADWREVVARDDIDIIHVCTPNSLHAEQAVAALEGGKHVYCDKPLAATLDEAERILQAARSAKGGFQTVFHYRFLPATLRAKELVDEGFLGEVRVFRAEYLHSGYVDPARPVSWRTQKEQSGSGALGDLGSHAIDMMLHLVGPFAALNATLETFVKERPTREGGTAPVDVDDAAYLTVRTRSGAVGTTTLSARPGAVGTIEASRVSTGANDGLRFEIHGTKGALRFNLMEPSWLEAYDNTLPEAPLGGSKGFTRIECANRYPGARLPSAKAPVGWERAHMECLGAFLKSIAEDREPSPSAEDGFAVQRVMDAALRSADAGRWVELA